MKPIHAKAKRHTTILRPFSGNRSDVIFMAEAEGGGRPSGKVEERVKGIMGYKSKLYDLKPENRFRIGALSNGYRLSVIPDKDVVIQFQTKHFEVGTLLKYIAYFFIGMTLLGILASVFGSDTPAP